MDSQTHACLQWKQNYITDTAQGNFKDKARARISNEDEITQAVRRVGNQITDTLIKKQQENMRNSNNSVYTKVHGSRKGGMLTNQDEDPQVKLTNLNTTKEEWADWTDDSNEDSQMEQSSSNEEISDGKWRFLNTLSPSIRVDEDEHENLLFRRGGYGLLITKEELIKCINMVVLSKTMDEINESIEVQALYHSTIEESERTQGQGLCAILALVGTLNPQLNSVKAIESRKGRSDIADIIESILIPFTQEYNQPDDFRINPRAQDHLVHRDHTIEYLVEIASILRSTTHTHVDQDKWMYATGAATVVQAMPSEVAYWQGIGSDRWISLNLWSCMTARARNQNIQTLGLILKPSTSHIAYLNSHFFNPEEIGINRYKNILIEIVNAIIVMKGQDDALAYNKNGKSEVIQPEELDEGCIATQKRGARWFMSISKKRARELSRLFPTQIEDELLQSKSTIQINKRTADVNWSLIDGDNYCGYQALHAVAMHTEGKTLSEISKNIKTKDKAYKLIAFLQKETSKLQSPNMRNALARVNAAINALKKNQQINKQSWCPTEMISHLLPTIQSDSNYWNHTRPPTGSYEWITSYYSKGWLESNIGIDVVYNGLDHYTIQLNTGIEPHDLREGINNLVNNIINGNNPKAEWSTIVGKRITRMTKVPTVVMLDTEEEYIEVISKRNQRKDKAKEYTTSHGHNITKHEDTSKYNRNTDTTLETPVNSYLRTGVRKEYAPKYHPSDDPIPSPLIPDIPFPKTQRKDPTARKDLVVAPSGIGSGWGVYTLSQIEENTVIMDYIDETKEIIMKGDIDNGTRDTMYMYANHKTNTYINASNNINSYCGLVNEALEDRHLNAIICETRDQYGRARVYYKTTRKILAREEIGTRYSIDGSYWSNAENYSDEFLAKVNACYQKQIPFQRNEIKLKEEQQIPIKQSNTTPIKQSNTTPILGTLGRIMKRYNSDIKNHTSKLYNSDTEWNTRGSEPLNIDSYIYETPIKNSNTEEHHELHQTETANKSDIYMEISDSEEDRSPHILQTETHEHKHHDNNPIDSLTNQEGNTKGISRKHKMTGCMMKRKRLRRDPSAEYATASAKGYSKHERGNRRVPKSERNNTRRSANEYMEISAVELQQLNKETLIEYILDQRCRHKKELVEKVTAGSHVMESSPKDKKMKAMDAVKRFINQSTTISPDLHKVPIKTHNLRTKSIVNYKEQLDDTQNAPLKKIWHKEPNKPRYLLSDTTVTDSNAFMIAGSTLKHNIQGVFARVAIPLRSSRKLFEYISENNYGTTQQDKVGRYLAYKSENKFVVNIGNVVVDATSNVNSYCNHVQELLSHTTPFNCKYVKSGNRINIIQTSPIEKNEELNIQYSADGSFWKNRISGYPEEVLKKAKKYYKITEPVKINKTVEDTDMPSYRSRPKEMDHKAEFNLMQRSNLYRWTSECDECNLRIATLNMNGALFESKNGEPQFILQLMVQCGFNILGLTDTRTPTDKVESIIKSLKYVMPLGTAVICFPTKRMNRDSTRLTTMGGQMIIIDKQWESCITHKRGDESGLSLIVSVGLTFAEQSITIIQIMVPPPSLGKHTMWSRIKEYLASKGINKTPRDYVLDTASKWHITELSKGKKVIIMGDFNRTYKQLEQWQSENDLQRAHAKIEIAQEHPDRGMYTYLRNSTTYSHIDHIYHSTLEPITIASVGATDHVHIHEKTDHFPIWVGINWAGYMKEKEAEVRSTSIRNQADLKLDDKESIEQFAKELDEYVASIEGLSKNITPEEAGRIQAAIYAKSSEIAKGNTKTNFQTTRKKGHHHRYKDGFSPSFRILQESLHAYINLGRALNRLARKTHTATTRLKEIHKIYPRWKKVYDKYSSQTHQEEHNDTHLFPLELNNISLQQCKNIDIAERVAQLKARLHGRQRTILRAKLSERCKEMQHSISINKLKKVIQMIIPTERAAFNFAAIKVDGSQKITDKLADLEANRIMKNTKKLALHITRV